MEQNLYPSLTPSAPYDIGVVESIINKQLAKVSSSELAEKRHGLFNTCFKQCLKHMYFFNVFFQMYFFKKTDLSFFNPYMSLVL